MMGEIHKLDTSGSRARKLTPDEKQLMADGRARSRLVDKYLREIATGKYHKRGPRKADPDAIQKELAEVDVELATAEGVNRLVLFEQRRQLEQALVGRGEAEAFEELEGKFLKVARKFSSERHISYESWRDMGVPARVLIKAGIYSPGRGRPKPSEDDQEE
jgi:hypothetical protein